MLKICIVGLGSMGKRHLANLSHLLSAHHEDFCIDALRSNAGDVLDVELLTLLRNIYFSSVDLPDDYDVLFICNPTALHFDAIRELANKTKNMFIEKPVFDMSQTDITCLHLSDQGVYYVACPLRYTRVIQYLKQFVDEHQIFSARIICSTYLPEWRPGTDYRTNYSARKELGGGVAIDLIHEWDYLVYLFGLPIQVVSMKGTYSNLEISSEDLAVYLGQYKDKLVTVHLDYFGRQSKREIELYTADDVVVGDLINKEIRFLKSKEVITLPEKRNEYQVRELKTFFDFVKGNQKNTNTIENAVEVLKIALGEYK
ncbi:Gfo/Idh/MocA family oxidoreductase [Oscillospiraceae bacterium PP1C4]